MSFVRIITAVLAAATMSTPLVAWAETDARTEANLKQALAGDHRSPENKARDAYRHPLETLKFFGLKDTMSVMEVWPEAGWYTEILAPVLKDHGRYIAGDFDPAATAGAKRMVEALAAKLAADPTNYGKVETAILFPMTEKLAPVPPGTLDMVLTFRNIHNWMTRGYAEAMYASFFAALKPGGYLGVVEHRGRADQPQDPKAVSGYVREDYAIALAEKAGFRLVATSEINANPKDTKDYPKGVWTLPPSYREGDVDRAKYAAIGESDRFTHLYQKPVK
ncbi:MAG: methyltransferase [Rhodospirillaceae bacterium]|nr:methyltransferase [Rhodospirillaceae bacterium]